MAHRARALAPARDPRPAAPLRPARGCAIREGTTRHSLPRGAEVRSATARGDHTRHAQARDDRGRRTSWRPTWSPRTDRRIAEPDAQALRGRPALRARANRGADRA